MKLLIPLILGVAIFVVSIEYAAANPSETTLPNSDEEASVKSTKLQKIDSRKKRRDFCSGDKVSLPNCGRPPGTKPRKSSNVDSKKKRKSIRKNNRRQCNPSGGGHACTPPK